MSEQKEVKKTPINIIPHPNFVSTIGFSRVSDAVAEFVDNSIQACREVDHRREISISFVFVGDTGGFVVVSDNGYGMDEACLNEYATYALDQETRGLQGKINDPSYISKFGVGAKQAGFYLGSRIRVVTKSADSDKVRELVLDNVELKRRFTAGEVVYTAEILTRDVGRADLTIPKDESTVPKLVEILHEHETSQEQFTSTIISLHAEMVKELKLNEHYKDVADELAEIYHFHSHPEHLPHRIVEMEKFKAVWRSVRG
jgi:hypothetical protein